MFKKFKNKKKHDNSFSDSEDDDLTPVKVSKPSATLPLLSSCSPPSLSTQILPRLSL
jgi:hypothetical protein